MKELPKVNRDLLLTHLQALVGERHPTRSPRALEKALEYVQTLFSQYGLRVEDDWFSYMGGNYRNIIGHLDGSEKGNALVVGAHIDTVALTPGADDNASGVAALLEAARIVAYSGSRRPIKFLAFNLEEWNMIGSAHYAKKLRKENVILQGMLSLEMVGFTTMKPGGQHYPLGLKAFYPDIGNFIGLIGNRVSRSLLKQVAEIMKQVPTLPVETLTTPWNGWWIPATRLSDHSSFWDQGYSALLVTDTAFLRNPHYHQPTDTIDTLDLNFLEKVCQGVVQVLLH